MILESTGAAIAGVGFEILIPNLLAVALGDWISSIVAELPVYVPYINSMIVFGISCYITLMIANGFIVLPLAMLFIVSMTLKVFYASDVSTIAIFINIFALAAVALTIGKISIIRLRKKEPRAIL